MVAVGESLLQEAGAKGQEGFNDHHPRRRREKKWTKWDKIAVVSVSATHLLGFCGLFCFSWSRFGAALLIGIVTSLFGINLSYHRHLTHKSFKLPKWLEYSFAYCGVHALQGDPLSWVSNHRFHHQYTDTERDPHSPVVGFWHSHMGWIFDSSSIKEKCGKRGNVGDLEKQAFYRWIRKTYVIHPLSLAILLYSLGGFPYICWGIGVRVVCCYHATWSVNSAAHIWGSQDWNTNDLSRNNWWVAIMTFGEGWHNNHHAFNNSARHGLEWWQIDVTWYVVKFLQAMGLAYDVKLPTLVQREKMAIKS
ncbi:unnamed protein product [Linum tenue]|uniref:Fatty acid desaturase domain-containing protein n=1 Tax=Linum tenue TaxID=586396 RepID=A0AAV0IDZ5_9ROSI|nr:unnamed protein product [Linum tenue]